MNKIIFLILLVGFSNTGISQATIAENISAGIAKKMKDSLGLTATEMSQVKEVNLFLASRKQSAFKEFTKRDSLQMNLQRVENMRDSLYKGVLPVEKYKLYKEKKRNLINTR